MTAEERREAEIRSIMKMSGVIVPKKAPEKKASEKKAPAKKKSEAKK